MSYQFEDESALEELLNQQLDRRKLQPVGGGGSSRPSTTRSTGSSRAPPPVPATANPSDSIATAARPSTASNLSKQAATFKYDEPRSQAEQAPSAKGKLASWLDRESSAATKQPAAVVSKQAPTLVEQQQQQDQRSSAVQQASSLSGDLPFAAIAVAATGAPELATSQGSGVWAPPIQTHTEATIREPPPLSSAEVDEMLEGTLREARLQEMSKQRLVQLIVDQVRPVLERVRAAKANERLAGDELGRLKSELALERDKFSQVEARHEERSKLAESKWLQLNRQLESRLALSERDLSETIERYRVQLDELNGEHKRQMDQLAENYQKKLEQERDQFEEALKRREEFHQLELESKLKVNCDLRKMETIFGEWHRMIQSTIGELELQFKSVESLLEKQTLEVKGTNTDLAKRSKLLGEQFEQFERQSELMGRLAQEIAQLMPNFTRAQRDQELMAKETGAQLARLAEQNEQTSRRTEELDQLRTQLAKENTTLEQGRFQLAIDSNRLAYKEERLNELLASNGELEVKLAEQRRQQTERELQLEGLRSSLDAKTLELKEQNYELHLLRRRLSGKQEELIKLQVEVDGQRKSVGKELARARAEGARLCGLRERAQKEVNQLRRLQKSLVCSLCLERLFGGDENGRASGLGPTSKQRDMAGGQDDDDENDRWLRMDDIQRLRPAPTQPSSAEATFAAKRPSPPEQFERELAKLSRRIELDDKQLAAENKYVELLSTLR